MLIKVCCSLLCVCTQGWAFKEYSMEFTKPWLSPTVIVGGKINMNNIACHIHSLLMTHSENMEITAVRAQCPILAEKILSLGGSTLLLSPAFGDNSANCPTLVHAQCIHNIHSNAVYRPLSYMDVVHKAAEASMNLAVRKVKQCPGYARTGEIQLLWCTSTFMYVQQCVSVLIDIMLLF